MKHVLLLITAAVAMAILTIVPAGAQQIRTLRSEMEVIRDSLGANFIYDSAIELNVPYSGKPMNDIIKSNSKEHSVILEECLMALFSGTGINYEIMKRYIVLTKSDSRMKAKDFTVLTKEQTDSIPESIITAYVERQYNSTQTGHHSIDFKRFGKGFAALGSPDVIKEIRSLPGVSEGTELLSGMYVHGGNGTDNLFLLDGVPLYQVTHLGGLISSFNTEIIEKLDFYKSGFPSRFGGKSSSVIDIVTRQGDMNSYHGSFNIGLLNGGFQFEGPIIPGKTSFNLSIRRSWFDLFTIPAMAIYNSTLPFGEKNRFRYALTDFNGSITHLFNQDNRLTLNIFYGSDFIRYGHRSIGVKYWEGVRFSGGNGDDLKTRWGNFLASLNWKKRFSDNLSLDAILYYTQVGTKVYLQNNKWDMDKYRPLTTELSINESNNSKLNDISMKTDVVWTPSDAHHIRAGASVTQHFFRQMKDVSSISVQERINTDETYYNTATVHDRDSVRNAYNPQEIALYIEDEISVVRWFKTNIGVRYGTFITGTKNHHSVEPRATVRLQMGQRAAFKLSYSEMSQFVHSLQANYLDIPMSSWEPSTDRILPSRSRQIAGGFHMTLPHNITLNVEGYWKSMSNLYEYCGISSIYPDIRSWESELTNGIGRSYGAEVEVSWNTDRTDISAYYTLSWTERYFKEIWHNWYPARNDNRHKFTINASHRVSKRFDIYLAWNYHTGDRMTIPTQIVGSEVFYSHPYNYKLPDYHRLDIGFNFRKTTKRGNESIWNLSLYNAYCRMNPMFAMFKECHEDDIPYAELRIISAIPIVPSFSYTLRF